MDTCPICGAILDSVGYCIICHDCPLLDDWAPDEDDHEDDGDWLPDLPID